MKEKGEKIMMEEVKKAIAAVEALGLGAEGEEICSTLINEVINTHVTFLNWRVKEIIDRLPMVGKWVTIYRKNQGEGYEDFEKWWIVDSKILHDFIMENFDTCKGLGLELGGAWFNFPNRLTVIAVDCDSFHHGASTMRKFEMARLEFIEDWLAKN